MPLYEYRCEEDGSTITLMRPMGEADDPVEDPKGEGRVFTRMHSTFAVGSSQGNGYAPFPQCGEGGCEQCPMQGH